MGIETVFVSQYVADGERTPILLDSAHSLDGVSWEYGANKITDKGLQTMKNSAQSFKSLYVGSLLSKKYEPLEIYVRAQFESVPISDSYAYMMSLYPDTADGLDLMKGYTAVDTKNLPITSEELNSLRSRLGLGLPTAEKQNVDVYPGNPDLLFTHAVSKNFPEWSSTIKNMRKSALDEFQGSHPNFIQDLKKSLGKESEDSLTLGNAIFYLDYYNMAISNGQTPSTASLSSDMLRQEKDYYRAFFDKGFLGKDGYNRVLANAYLKHIVNLMRLKKQDLTENNLSDKRIHELKASLDFGSKLTTMSILKVLEQPVGDWGYTYGDTLTWQLMKDGDKYKVKSLHNGNPMNFGSKSSSGEMDIDEWTNYMISKMYYGSITDLQKESGAENPENHLTRDAADSESELQWWENQKKYEDRVLLKKTLDTTALSLQSIDREGKGVTGDDDDSDSDKSSATKKENLQSPSAAEVVVGSTSESETSAAISTDLMIDQNDEISGEKTLQFNTYDKVGNFERTTEDGIDIASGESVTLGLDNVEAKDVQTALLQEINLDVSHSKEIELPNSHKVRLDGSEST